MRPNTSISMILVTTLCLVGVAQQTPAQQSVSAPSNVARSADGATRLSLPNLIARVWRSRRQGFSLMPSSSYASTNGISAGPAPPSAVLGSGTVGKISMWIDTGPSGNSILGDSIITQLNGNIGIGTDAPTSKLAVQGMIETTMGGYKFPDGTVQTTAGLTSVFHDSTLAGDGTPGSPLGVAVPLNLSGMFPTILSIRNNGNGGGDGVRATGASGGSTGGSGVIATGGGTESGVGGDGVSAGGGSSASGQGGTGLFAQGGFSESGKGGSGGEVRGGASPGGDGGTGLVVKGGLGGVSNSSTGGIGVIVTGGVSLTENLDIAGAAGVESTGASANSVGGAGVVAIGGSFGGIGVEARGGASKGSAFRGGPGIRATGGDPVPGGRRGQAGIFGGDVDISNGDLNLFGAAGCCNLNVQGTKNFKIDHPLDPENKYLLHASIESSEVLNIYSGNIVTNVKGEAVVTLPDWFEVLNRDLRYQLTVIGKFAQAIVAEKVRHNRFTIRTSAPNIEVSWQVTGVRSDRVMREHPFSAEEDKREQERGYFLSPAAAKTHDFKKKEN